MDSVENFYKGKRVLVTGGAGCIGSCLVEKLDKLGANVFILDNMMRGGEAFRNLWEIMLVVKNKPKIFFADVTKFEEVKDVFEKTNGFDVVFHLAALPSHRLALEDPRAYIETDVMGTGNILEAARLSKTPTVVFASSNKVYGKQQPPFREDKPCLPEGPYALAKFQSEQLCEMYTDYWGLNTPVIRFHHVLGPRTQPDREISIFTEQIINGETPMVHGVYKGEEFTSCAADYTDVNDAVEGTLLAGMLKGFDTFNLATGKVTTVEDIAKKIMVHLNKESPLNYKQMLAHETLVHLSDISKANRILGWTPKRTAEESIKNYVDWRLKIGARPDARYK